MEPRRLTPTDRVALAWGIAEGVVFFVVPDVVLTFIAARYGLRRGVRAVWWALAGAIIGGLVAYTWGAAAPESANRTMAALPAIDETMIATVNSQVAEKGPVALVAAPLRGRPYKLYATAAGQMGASPLLLILWTIPGRLWRFLGATALFGVLHAAARRADRPPASVPTAIWAVFWILLYSAFWLG